MIKRRDCAFQDGSYPCGYEDKGELPNCKLCHKIRQAGIREAVKWVETNLIYVALEFDGTPALHLQTNEHKSAEKWQAKLKE